VGETSFPQEGALAKTAGSSMVRTSKNGKTSLNERAKPPPLLRAGRKGKVGGKKNRTELFDVFKEE